MSKEFYELIQLLVRLGVISYDDFISAQLLCHGSLLSWDTLMSWEEINDERK